MKNASYSIANCPTQLKVISCFTFLLFFISFFSLAQPGIWQKKQSLGITANGRQYGVGFSIGNKGYFGTGISINDNFRNDFWEYDPATNAWTQKANFGGAPRGGAIGFNIGGKGYIGTGVIAPSQEGYTNDFWECDPATNAWTRKADFGGLPTVQAVGFSIGNKGYVGTGFTINDFSNDFWEYDPATDAWTRKANFGGDPRYGAAGFSIGNKGYIGTGHNEKGNLSGNEKDFWEYDTTTDTWTQKADDRCSEG
jgi:N-acetylneuraminic acid mutarotase